MTTDIAQILQSKRFTFLKANEIQIIIVEIQTQLVNYKNSIQEKSPTSSMS